MLRPLRSKQPTPSRSENSIALKWDLDAALNDLNKLLANAKVDKTGAIAQMDKVTSLEERLKRIRLGMMIDIKNVLTEGQQRTLKDLRTDTDMKYPCFLHCCD